MLAFTAERNAFGKNRMRSGHRLGLRLVLATALCLAADVLAQTQVKERVIGFGAWSVATTAYRQFDLPTDISPTQIKALSAIVRSDAGELFVISRMPDYLEGSGGYLGLYYDTEVSKWQIAVNLSGYYSTAANTSRFDDQAINRGYITIRYSMSSPSEMPQDRTLFFRFNWDMASFADKTMAIPGLPVATSSVTDYQTTIYTNPSGGVVDVDKFSRPSGAMTSGTRDRGGRDEVDANKNLKMHCGFLRAPRSPVTGPGRFVGSPWSGQGNPRGWAMVKYNASSNSSTLSQPFGIMIRVVAMGGWNAHDATTPLALTLSNTGVDADRIVFFQALAISDVTHSGFRAYHDYHGLPATGYGGAGITISGKQNRIFFHSNTYSFGSHYFHGSQDNRGFLTMYYRAADCGDGTGTVLTSGTNVGSRTVPALVS